MADEQSPDPPIIGEILSEPIITVKVGPQANEYHIHKGLLVRYSGFFRGALSSPAFSSAEEGVVVLEDIDTGTFDAFAYWLYYQTLVSSDECDEEYPQPCLDEDKGCEHGRSSFGTRLTRWYVLADRFIVPDFKECLIDLALEEFQDQSPWYQAIIYAWTNLPEDSPFLRLLVDAHCHNWSIGSDERELQSNIDALPSCFLYRAMWRMKECHMKGIPSLRERSGYDEPSKEETEVESMSGSTECLTQT